MLRLHSWVEMYQNARFRKESSPQKSHVKGMLILIEVTLCNCVRIYAWSVFRYRLIGVCGCTCVCVCYIWACMHMNTRTFMITYAFNCSFISFFTFVHFNFPFLSRSPSLSFFVPHFISSCCFSTFCYLYLSVLLLRTNFNYSTCWWFSHMLLIILHLSILYRLECANRASMHEMARVNFFFTLPIMHISFFHV